MSGYMQHFGARVPVGYSREGVHEIFTVSSDLPPDSQYTATPFHTPMEPRSQAQQDQEAFWELQHYAEFQRKLLDIVRHEASNVEEVSPAGIIPSNELDSEDIFQATLYAASLAHHRTLSMQPICISETVLPSGGRGWSRAYSPALLRCGIEQQAFLGFIDEFNEVLKTWPNTGVVNIGLREISSSVISTAITYSQDLLSFLGNNNMSSNFLSHANERIFLPNELFAMVVSFHTGEAFTSSLVDISQPRSNTASKPLPNAQALDLAPLTHHNFQPPPASSPRSQQSSKNRHKDLGARKQTLGSRNTLLSPLRTTDLYSETLYLLIVPYRRRPTISTFSADLHPISNTRNTSVDPQLSDYEFIPSQYAPPQYSRILRRND